MADETTTDDEPVIIVEEVHEEETHEEIHEEESAEGIAAVAGQFGLKGDIFVAQLINFVIVLLVLWKFAYKPIVRMLDERSERIEKSVKSAEGIEKRVEAIEGEREEILNTARTEAQGIAQKAHDDASARQDEMVEAAKREVERVISKGKQSLAEERSAMLRDLRKDVADIATLAAERILKDGIDQTKAQSLAEEVVRKAT